MQDSCTYCGEPAVLLDHVIPYCYAGRVASKARKGSTDAGQRVPACFDCNNYLGAQLIPTVEARRAYILGKLRWRLKKSPEWTEKELNELGPSLKQAVLENIARDNILRARIAFGEGDS